jgi:hypothetical protein
LAPIAHKYFDGKVKSILKKKLRST